MSRSIQTIVCTASALALVACAPLSPDLRISDVQVGNPATDDYGINANTATIVGTKLVVQGPIDPNQSPNRVNQINPPNPAPLGILPPGRYFGVVTWDYKRLFSGNVETINSSSVDFQVVEPNGCFSFNFSSRPAVAGAWTPSTQGWSTSQYFIGDTNVLASQTSRAQIYPLNDQIVVNVIPNVLRTPSTVPQWRTDVGSPSLEKNAPWQTTQGLQYYIGANFYSGANLKAQSILVVRKADGTVALFAEGTQTNRVFHSIAQWTQITSPIPLPPGSTVLGAIVRIFGLMPLPPGPDIKITIDDICPVP